MENVGSSTSDSLLEIAVDRLFSCVHNELLLDTKIYFVSHIYFGRLRDNLLTASRTSLRILGTIVTKPCSREMTEPF